MCSFKEREKQILRFQKSLQIHQYCLKTKTKKKGPQKKNGFTKAENQKPTPQNDLHKLAVKNMVKFHKSQDYTIY